MADKDAAYEAAMKRVQAYEKEKEEKKKKKKKKKKPEQPDLGAKGSVRRTMQNRHLMIKDL